MSPRRTLAATALATTLAFTTFLAVGLQPARI